ncbi:phosphate/phosphonate ABC transporter permease [Lacticaseibacillus baoqingensis]|uniref:Phosphate/phosphonate ABC transporter permease n=1 Tax=Lacticaseibacillus baoqingensis TaxID=2486013 RepID=A0ABW4E8M4_9LACO|nr:phosphate/phosphonate ABC transporter permease [Lacticaseibacillus baoqingensis]
MPNLYLRQTARRRWLTLIAALGLLVAGQLWLQLNDRQAFMGVWAGLAWLVHNFTPDAAAWHDLPTITYQLWRTIVIAIAATSVAAIVAVGLGLAGAATTGRIRWLRGGVRLFASVMRNFPFVAWALVLLFSFKQNDFTGFLALFLMTIGYLTRAFIETLEEVGGGAIEALEATGARYWPIVIQGVLPAAIGGLLSWVLYMIENNIRDATLVGMLTGTGIGFTFDLYFKSFRYPSAGLVVVTLIITTIAIELLATHLRQVLTH